MKIINLTQHTATPEQVTEGVFDLPEEQRQQLAQLLTFRVIPDYQIIRDRVVAIGDLVEPFFQKGDRFMVGGAPYLMQPLWAHLDQRYSALALYAFTERVSVEDPATGVKTSVFKHAGWVPHFGDY